MSTVSLKLKTRIFTNSNHAITFENGSGVTSSTVTQPKVVTTRFNATPTVNVQATIVTVTFTANAGYYYASEPSFILRSSNPSAFEITQTLNKDSNDRILSKVFVVKYKNSVSMSNQTLIFDYVLKQYLFTETQINSFLDNSQLLEIKGLQVDETDLLSTGGDRSLSVFADPGSYFKLNIIQDNPSGSDKTYDFDTEQFTSAVTESPNYLVDTTGVYSKTIKFPEVTADDTYSVQLIPIFSLGTTIDPQIVPTPSTNENNNFLITKTIYQYKKIAITLSLSSASYSGSYNSMPSDITIYGERNSAKNTPTVVTWPVSLSQNAFYINRQPLEIDFRTILTKTASGSNAAGEAFITLNSTEGLFAGLVASGTNIPTATRVIAVDNENSKITLSANLVDAGVSDGATISFTYGGSSTSSNFTGHEFRVGYIDENETNPKFKVTLADVATKVNGAVTNSQVVNVDSQAGILARPTVFVSGRGIGGSVVLPHVDAITYQGVNNRLQLSAAQTLDDNVELVFTGSSQSATITFDYYVDNFGTSDITLTLFLDSIIPVA